MVSVLCIQLLVNEVAMQAQGAFLPYGLGQIYATSVHKKKTSGKKNPQKKRVSKSAPNEDFIYLLFIHWRKKKK